MRATRAQALLANVGLSLVATALLLGLLEGAARLDDRLRLGVPLVLPDPAESLYAARPYLGVVLRPSAAYRGADASGSINTLGLRGPETTRLEPAGVPGYTTAGNVIDLGLRLLDLQPDVVALQEGCNDFKSASHPGFATDYSHWRRRDAPPRRPPLERLLLCAKLGALVARVRPARGEDEVRDPSTGRRLPRRDAVPSEGLDAFRHNLRTMIATARSAGAASVLATYAHPCTDENQASRPELMRYLPQFVPGLTFRGVQRAFDLYNDVVRDVARREGAALADAGASLPPDADLFVDHVHHSPHGADAFARIVAEAVARVLPSVSPRPTSSS